ncbi:hypothetical protein A6R68_10149 [Neotoma lepida]|uniref:Uncharacterized protein n=1 Tax=Neotoma lepida TaxID=56216 RepID=A0A1A6FYS4_NEOLE|nr:hypothetical protein A6R68_10149 [Neotoma lepida]
MSSRIDDLEKNIADLMTQAGVEELEGHSSEELDGERGEPETLLVKQARRDKRKLDAATESTSHEEWLLVCGQLRDTQAWYWGQAVN